MNQLLICFLIFFSTNVLATEPLTEIDSTYLTNEVMAQVKKEHAFDVRSVSYSLMLGQAYIHEGNNFENSAYQFGISSPFDSGNLFRFWVRRVWIEQTHSTRQLARTPFKQPSLMNRYELHMDFGYSIMEGRSFTRLGPWITDVENSIHLLIGGYYSHPNQGTIPQRSDTPEPLPGQDPFNSKMVLNAGILWQLYFSSGLGIYLEMNYNFPIEGAPKFSRWKDFSWGLLWSIED